MITDLFKIISLTLPIFIPGLVLIFVIKKGLFNFLSIPIDLNKTIYGKRIFGDNKTFRGIIIIFFMAIITTHFLSLLYRNGYELFIDDVFENKPLTIGLVYSFSYVFGELLNSLIKRQMNIPAGRQANSSYKKVQKFFDLSDGIIVVCIGLFIFTTVSKLNIFLAGVIGLVLHMLTDMLMKKLDLKKKF